MEKILYMYGVHIVKALNNLEHFEAEEPKMEQELGKNWKTASSIHTGTEPGTAQPTLWVPAWSQQFASPRLLQGQSLPKWAEGTHSYLSRAWLRKQSILWCCFLICPILGLMYTNSTILGCSSQPLCTGAPWTYKEDLAVEPLLQDALKKVVLIS